MVMSDNTTTPLTAPPPVAPRRSLRLKSRTPIDFAEYNDSSSDIDSESDNEIISFSDAIEFDDFDDEDASTPPSTKQQQNNHDNSSTIISSSSSSKPRASYFSLDLICDDVIRELYYFFDNPRDLYNLSMCSKRLHSIVNYSHVIRAAVFQQGNALNTISLIMNDMKKGAIYTPSVHRLLRLVNAKRCELGDNCWGYDMITEKSVAIRLPRAGFGLFICRKCVNGLSSSLSRDVMWSLLEENKVATTLVDTCHRGVNQLFKEAVTKDYIGPLLNVRDLKQVSSTYNCRDGNIEDVQERSKMIQILHENRLKYGKYEGNGEQLTIIYEEAREDLQVYNTKQNEEYSRRQEERTKRRSKKLRDIHGKLMDLMDGHDCQEFALDCTWYEGCHCSIYYSCVFVEDILCDLMAAPSGCTTKRLTELANKIKETFDLLDEKEFFSFKYLSQDDPFESALRTYCLSGQLTKKELFSKLPPKYCHANGTETPFILQIRKDKLSDALYMALDRHDEVFQQAFAASLAHVNDIEGFDMDDFQALAKSIWKFKTPTSYNVRTKEDVKAQLAECIERYDTVKDNIIAFLSTSDVRHFLSVPEDLRRNVLRTIFTRKGFQSLLYKKRYSTLKKKLIIMHNNPERFDLG